MGAKAEKREYNPDYISPPGDTIADLLEERVMTQTELAERLGVSLKHANQVIKGVASISPELALGLDKVFGMPASFWLNRESIYQAERAQRAEREDLARHVEWAERFPIKELKRREFLPHDVKGVELVASILKFFGIASPEQWKDPLAAFRKSPKFKSDTYALSAWLRAGRLRADEIDCKPYDAKLFRSVLSEVRGMTRLDPGEWHPMLVERCAAAGVAVVIEPELPKSRVNGATRWLSPSKALIQLSLRNKWEDIVWFTFFHEAGHVLLHRKKSIFVEAEDKSLTLGDRTGSTRFEEEADRFAAQTLIPPPFEARLPELSLAAIPSFARELGVTEAIVVGRLHHNKLLAPSGGNNFRRRLEMSD